MSTSNASSINGAQDTGRTIETSPLQPNSFLGKRFLPFRKTIFSNDQEVFIDSPTPLILLSDNNVVTPYSPITKNFSTLRRSYLRNADTTSASQNNTPSKRLDGMEISEGEESVVTKTVKSAQSKKELEDSVVKAKDSSIQEDVDIFKVEDKDANTFRAKVGLVLESKVVRYLIGIFIFYALFANDFRQAALGVAADTPFDVLTIISLGLFSIEILMNLYVKKDYRWSFLFWLDFISTLSIVLDITFVNDEVFPAEAANAVQLARAARATRIGARAGRVLRMLQLLPTSFFMKKKKKGKNTNHQKIFPSSNSQSSEMERLYDPFHKTPRDKERRISDIISRGSSDMTPVSSLQENLAAQPLQSQFTLTKELSFDKGESNDEPELRQRLAYGDLRHKGFSLDPDNASPGESRVGKKLLDLTTMRVILIVFALLLIVPLFGAEFYFTATASGKYELNLLRKIFDSPDISEAVKQEAMNNYVSDENQATVSLAMFVLNGTVIYQDHTVDFTNLRDLEKQVITIETTRGEMVCTFRKKIHVSLEAWLNIGRTILVTFILVLCSLMFSKDANNLVLRPIERMIEKVNRIARNPLIAKEENTVRDANAGLENETVLIENAIIKIGGLLALGFGDAGSAIIAKNMAQTGDLNPMLAGKKMAAIFGFCDIRNFTDATEVLQEGVMVFVNSIADIVHSTVDKYTGAANKNIGDAFLLVWKLPEELVYEKVDGILEIQRSKITNNMADLALISFLKIHARVNRDPTLLAYRQNPGLCARLPNYKVKMGFGLHIGWAIEGAIGSEFKVDASYLSPNVNMASRLEAATKQYGVPLLFSGELYHRLSRKTQEKGRLIDIVKVKGSDEPVELYTCDMDIEDFSVAKNREKVPKDQKRDKQKAQKHLYHKVLAYGTASSLFEADKELMHMFRNHDANFYSVFQLGMDAYIRGDWSTAKKKFEECLNIRKEDGPTRNLYNYLRDNDYIAPEDWEGYRVLTEK